MNRVLCTCVFKSQMLVIVGAEIKGLSRDVISHIRAFKGHFGLCISSVREFCFFSPELWLGPEGPLRSLQWMFWILSFNVWRWFSIALLSIDDRRPVHWVLGHHRSWCHYFRYEGCAIRWKYMFTALRTLLRLNFKVYLLHVTCTYYYNNNTLCIITL